MDESTTCLCFKLSSEKSSPGDIVVLQWSPKMDLLAMAMKDGSVSFNCMGENAYAKVHTLGDIKQIILAACVDGSTNRLCSDKPVMETRWKR